MLCGKECSCSGKYHLEKLERNAGKELAGEWAVIWSAEAVAAGCQSMYVRGGDSGRKRESGKRRGEGE